MGTGDGKDEENLSNDDEIKSSVPLSSIFNSKMSSMESALQSLDTLSEQIVQFLFTSSPGSLKSTGNIDSKLIPLLPQQEDALYASLTLMRRLLMDAQAKFKKMVENNRRLASHIDGTIKTANQEVNTLRLELNVTNEKLRELSIPKDTSMNCQCKELNQTEELAHENQSLTTKTRQLEKEIAMLKQQILNNENRSRNTIDALQCDRNRLKTDKSELLYQIQEMQKTIDDKEEQLREFLREFESQMKENEDIIKESDQERNRLSREKNDLTRKHQDLSEVVATLRTELVASERKIRELETELSILRQTALQTQSSKRRSINVAVEESAVNQKCLNFSGSDPNSSMRSTEPLLVPSSSPLPGRHYIAANGFAGGGNSSSSTEDLQGELCNHDKRPKLVQHLSGSLSRAFKKTKNRKSLDFARYHQIISPVRPPSLSVGCLPPDVDVFLNSSRTSLNERTEDEKKEILRNNQNVAMQRWKADAVLVWLELVLHMEQYVKEFEENIKSGKILLGLTECDLEKCVGIIDPLHRRKLCLAVDEFRNPAVTIANTSAAGQLDHWWVCEQWLRDVGLTQYASRFREHLIDGRTLASLTRKDLERYMGMDGKKLHQESILRGVELLEMLAFNTQRLDERRLMSQSCDNNTDLLVWNNNRLIQWTKSIDLKEYSVNLRNSGVHGALIVLDFTFTSEDLASALGIPINKATVRRHLASEFDILVKQARESLGDEIRFSADEIGKKGSFSRSVSANQKGRKGIRSSISRSFGRQLSRDLLQIGGK